MSVEDSGLEQALFQAPSGALARNDGLELHRANVRQFSQRLGSLAVRTLLAAIPLAAGLVGAYEGTTVPTHVEFTEGISANISVQHKSYTTADLGVMGAVRLPAASYGGFGSKAEFDPINIDGKSGGIGQLVGLVADGGAAIKDRAMWPLALRAAEGGAVGAAAGGLAVAGMSRLKKRRQANRLSAEPGASGEPPENFIAEGRTSRIKNTIKKAAPKVVVGMAAGSVFIAVGAKYEAVATSSETDVPIITPLPDRVANLNPILGNAVMVGTGGQLGNKGIEAALGYVESVNRYWQENAQSTIAQIKQLRAGNKLGFMDDSNQFVAVHVSDIHANIPYIKYYLGPVIRELGVKYVLDSGDNYNGSNSAQSTEDKATKPMQRILDALSPQNQNGLAVRLVYAAGNHDPLTLPHDILKTTFTAADGEKFQPVVPLDNQHGNHVTIDGVTIVGSPDLNRTTTGPNPTVPSLLTDQIKNDYKQGAELADIACQTTEATGVKPIVVSHEQEGGYESLVRGCASVTLSGHLHVMQAPNKYVTADGATVYSENIGSGPGDGPGNLAPAYSNATTLGGLRVLAVDKTTGVLSKVVTIDVSPHGKPEIAIEDGEDLQASASLLKSVDFVDSIQTYAPSLYQSYVEAPDKPQLMHGVPGSPFVDAHQSNASHVSRQSKQLEAARRNNNATQ